MPKFTRSCGKGEVFQTFLKSYLDFKDALIEFSVSGADKADQARALAFMIKSVAAVLVAMRRDIGYRFTSFSAKELGRLQLANDAETMKIFDHL